MCIWVSRRTLRDELQFRNMTVKELSIASGIKKQTLDNYLSTHNSIPSVEVAVKIAQALNVSVEYLVTGKDTFIFHNDQQLRILALIFQELDDSHKQLLIDISRLIKKI